MKFRLGLNGMATAPQQHAAGGFGQGMQAMFMAPLMAAQAAGEAQKDEATMAAHAATARQADAHAALFGVQADEGRAQLAARSFESVLRNAALQNGVAPHQLPDFTGFATTGQLPGQYVQPPADLGGGPALPPPAWATPDVAARIWQTLGLTQNALAQGDKSVENVAKAAGEYQDQGIARGAVAAAGRGDDMTMSRLNTIRGKKEFTPFKAVGTTGTALNEITGQQPVTNDAMYALFGNDTRAQTFQRNAAGQASQAQMRHSDAGTRKLELELEQGRRNGNLQVVTGPNGEVTIIDKVNRTAEPVLNAAGQPVIKGAAGGGGKPMTEAQSKANLFGGRMLESDAVLNELEDKGVTRPGTLRSVAEGVAGAVPIIGDKLADGAVAATNWTQSSAQQRVDQARRDFINAVLRRESGAAISQSEFENATKQYFPTVGDSKEVLAQKRRNRQIATTLMLKEVPEAQRYKFGDVPLPGAQRGGATGSWDAQPAPAGQRNVPVTY